MVKENQPGALVNSRLGQGFGHFDVSIDNGKTPSVSKAAWLLDLKVPWQTHESVTQRGWGYTSFGAENDRSEEYSDFIYSLCRIVGNGGVYLLNVAPRPDGTIPQSQINSITAIGDWLKINGEAIYGADPSPLKFPPYAITSKPGKIYLLIKKFESSGVSLKGLVSKVSKAYCLSDIQQKGLSFKQEKDFVKIDVPESLRDPKVTVVVLDLEDEIAKVVDETLQQQKDGSIVLPVEKCEYKIRRISYDYEEKVTHRWGENPKQGLMWTVNVSQPGIFKIITEDNGDDRLQFEIKTVGDTQILDAKGNLGAMHKKLQTATVRIEKKGIQQIVIHPSKLSKKSSRYKFKGLELIPVDK